MTAVRAALAWLAPLLAMIAAIVPSTARAEDASDWQVDKMPDHCILQRTMPEPRPALLAIKTYPGSDSYEIVLAAHRMPAHGNPYYSATITLHGPEASLKKGVATGARLGDYAETAQFTFHKADFGDLARVTAFSFTVGSNTLGPLSLSDVADAIAALDACSAEHLVAMGADPKQFQPGGSPPVALTDRDSWLDSQLQSIVSVSPYGVDAKFKLDVDTDGRAATCSRVGAARGDSVEKIACKAVLGKILFKPAHDPAGNPVKGVASFALQIVRREYSSSVPL
jgi:hypothetical protein